MAPLPTPISLGTPHTAAASPSLPLTTITFLMEAFLTEAFLTQAAEQCPEEGVYPDYPPHRRAVEIEVRRVENAFKDIQFQSFHQGLMPMDMAADEIGRHLP